MFVERAGQAGAQLLPMQVLGRHWEPLGRSQCMFCSCDMPQIADTAAEMLTGGIDFWLDDRRRRRLLLLVQLLKGMLELNQTC